MIGGTRLLSRLFNRRVGAVLLWGLLMAGVALAVNLTGIHVVGSIGGWERWLHAHARHFLVWRLLLYAAMALGWWWLRARLRQREPAVQAHRRLMRIEIAAVVTLMLLEGSQLLRHG
jgi:hypothetical protein